MTELHQQQLQLGFLGGDLHLLVVVAQEGEGHVAPEVGDAHLAVLLGPPVQQGVNLETLPALVVPRHPLLHEGEIPVEEYRGDEVPGPQISVDLCRL